jgi:DNA-binding MarR family transcriptional regulator
VKRHLVREVQRYYPQIYLACHVDHVRARSTPYRVSSHDAALLAHLDTREPITAGQLAAHLGVVPSTLSESLRRLETLGYAARTRRAGDRRTVELRLTEAGAEAMAGGSVLDAERVARLLGRLTPAERTRAVRGLALLARAARALPAGRRTSARRKG